MINGVFVSGLLAVFLFGAACSGEGRKGYFTGRRDKAIEACTELFEIDLEKVIDTLSKFKAPEDPAFPCWYNCFLIEMGVKKNHRIDWKMVGNVTLEFLNDEYNEEIDKLYETCEEELPTVSKNDCELAYEFLLCEIRNWFRVGLPAHN